MSIVSLYLSITLLTSPASFTELMSAEEGLWYGNVPWAFEHLERALKLDPKDTDVLYSLACLYIEQQEPEKAKPLLEKLTALDPNHHEAWLLLGTTLWQLGLTEEATKVNQAALARDPNSKDGLELQEKLHSKEAPPGWLKLIEPHLRIDLGTGYDSNVTLGNDASNISDWVSSQELGLNLWSATRHVPLLLKTYLKTGQSLTGNADVNDVMPAELGIALEYLGHIGWLGLELGLDYAHSYTSGFEDPYEERLGAQVLGRWGWTRNHYSEATFAYESIEAELSLPPTTGNRGRMSLAHFFNGDHIKLGALGWYTRGSGYIAGQTIAIPELMAKELPPPPQDRKAAEPNDPPPSFTPPELNHNELGIQLMADWSVSSDVVLYSFLSLSHRQADVEMMTPFNFLFESSWTDQLTTSLLGAGYQIADGLELYLEHSFAKNESLDGLSFSRHLMVGGVRYDYR